MATSINAVGKEADSLALGGEVGAGEAVPESVEVVGVDVVVAVEVGALADRVGVRVLVAGVAGLEGAEVDLIDVAIGLEVARSIGRGGDG